MEKIQITSKQQLKDYLQQNIPQLFNAKYKQNNIVFENNQIFLVKVI